MKSTTRISVWVPPELAEALQQLAAEDAMSISSTGRRLLSRGLAQERGLRRAIGAALSAEESRGRETELTAAGI